MESEIKIDISSLSGKTILVTGVAGFIGSNVARKLLAQVPQISVVGIDSMSKYYDVNLKNERLEALLEDKRFNFIKGSIADRELVDNVFMQYRPQVVINLAAQAGVRYSITNPDEYIETNITGFYNILEAARRTAEKGADGVAHLVFASSSSIYGANAKVPYSTDDKADEPVSLYAATKRSNELMAHAYSKLYDIPTTGLRFFTVYGPAGRPDMAYFSFTEKLVRGEKIKVFNYGNCKRDFTYIDDIVEGIVRVAAKAPERRKGDDGLPVPPYRLYNIGNGHPESLINFINILSDELIRVGVLPADFDIAAHQELVPMQPGDVPITYADTSSLEKDFEFHPNTPLRTGLRKFAEWYANYRRKEK